MISMRKYLLALGIVASAAIGAVLTPIGGVIAQGIIGIFQNGLPTAPAVYGVGDSTAGLYFQTGLTGFTKHESAGSVAAANLPVLSGCGTSPALGSGSTDHAGKITVGTSASNACVLTFGTSYGTAPFCIVQNLTTGAAANIYAISATAITWSSALADSTVLEYICIGEGN